MRGIATREAPTLGGYDDEGDKMMNTLLPVLVAVTLTLASAAGSAQGIDKDVLKLSIERKSLRDALNDWAQQTGYQLIAEIRGDYVAPEVEGWLTAQEALERLLTGTPLTYQWMGERLVAVMERSQVVLAAWIAPGSKQTVIRVARLSGNEPERVRLAADDQSVAQTNQGSRNERRTRDAESDMEVVEEIVVTAQKRAERLQDVPISMNVVTEDEIRRRGLVSSGDYLRGMPGVSEVPGYYGDTIVIRGIETSPGYLANFGSGTQVATYFGETPTAGSAGMAGGSNIDLKLVDIERVEVLRGPQGTAFGDASLGGAVRAIPMLPKLTQFEGNVTAGYSETGDTGGANHSVQGVVNLPLVDAKLAIRAVGYTFRDRGYIQNVAGSDSTFQAYSEDVGQEAVDADHVGDRFFNGGRVSALFQATDRLQFSATFLRQTTEIDGQPHTGTSDAATAGLATLGPYQQAVPVLAPEQTIRGEKLGILLTDINLSNVTVQYSLGWGDVLATTSHVEGSSSSVTELQIPGLPSQRGVGPHRETTGEVRLASNLDGAWDFLVGLYGQKSKDSVLFDYWWFRSPDVGLAVANGGNRYFGDYDDERALKQRAAYGQVSWEFLENLTLTGGVRAYKYDRDTHVVTTGLLFGPLDSRTESDASGESWRGNLSYKPNDDTLFYATFSEGFRLGKSQPGLPEANCGNGSGIVRGTEGTTNVTIAATRIVNSDFIESYELGTRFALLDRRLTLSADVYRMEWTGVPVSVNAPAPPDGCGLTYVTNAGKAKSQGVEFQANYTMARGFRIDLGASYVDAALTQDVPSLAAVSGDRLPGSPKVNGTLGVQYALNIADREGWVRVDATHVGTFYGDLQQTPETRAGGFTTLAVSGGVNLTPNLSVRLDVRNLTNKDEYVFRNFTNTGPQYGYPLQPRTVGVQLNASF